MVCILYFVIKPVNNPDVMTVIFHWLEFVSMVFGQAMWWRNTRKKHKFYSKRMLGRPQASHSLNHAVIAWIPGSMLFIETFGMLHNHLGLHPQWLCQVSKNSLDPEICTITCTNSHLKEKKMCECLSYIVHVFINT